MIGREPFVLGVVLALAALSAVASEDPMPPQDNVLDYESRSQSHVIPDPDIPVNPPWADEPAIQGPPPPWQPEEDALWELLRESRLEALEEAIGRMRESWPDWSPPQRLVELAAQARIRQAISSARATGDDGALVGLGTSHPAYFGCQDLGNAWARAEALGRLNGRPEEAAVYRDLLGRCPDPASRIANLQKLRALTSSRDFLAILVETEASDGSLAGRPEFRDIDRQTRHELAASSAREGNFAAAEEVLRPAGAEIIAAQDADGAAILAWACSELGRTAEALEWEERLASWGVDRGIALPRARLAAGDEAGALKSAEAIAAHDPDAARLAFGIRTSRAATAADCQGALRELTAAERLGTLEREHRRLRAWALNACGRHAEASAAFADLYRETGADEDAEGLLVADWRGRRLQHSEALAQELHGPLAERLPGEKLPREGENIRYERLTLSDDGRVRVLHRRGWSAWGGLGFLSRRGDGPGRLDAWRSPLARASFRNDAHEWRVDADHVDLESDPASPADWPLSVPDYLPDMTESTDGIEGRIAWRRYRKYAPGDFDVQAALGFTPTGQEISSTLTGRLALGRGEAGSGWTVALERDSVRESVTSWTGSSGALTVDGTTTIPLPFHWGRVTRTGLALSGYFGLDDRWHGGGSARAGSYTGENVPDNVGGELYGELQRDLWESGSWRFSAGPWIYASAFEKNLGRFSPGHGGYFSPAWLVQTGLSARMGGQAGDGPWYFDARLDAGWQRHREDAAPFIPDRTLRARFLAATGLAEGDLGTFESRTRSAFAGGLELEGMRRIGETAWHAGGLVSLRMAPQYDESTAMILVRYGSQPPATDQIGDYRDTFRSRR